MKRILFLIFSLNCAAKTVQINNTKIVIEKGDITHSKTEAIVNAANKKLLGGNGVCGAIFKAAGHKLQGACNRYPENKNGTRCHTGHAKITKSFKLKKRGIKYIIHAVGPDCRIVKDEIKQNKLLKKAYKNSLSLADKHNIKSIAFPFISSAIYAFPRERACKIALEAVKDYIKHATQIEEVRFVLFSDADFSLFCLRI